MGVQITNGRGSYSVSQVQARVTTTPLDCAIVFGTYCIRWKEWTEKVYRAGGAPKSNQWRRRWIQNAEASHWCEERSIGRHLTISYWAAPQTHPKPTPEKCKEVQVGLGGSFQYMRQWRFDACIVVPWPLDQGTRIRIVAISVAATCHHPHMSHNHGFRFRHGCLGTLFLSIYDVWNILCWGNC